ncbi:membrane-bound lytic murein transglycosylase F [Tamilnaduibacter salinus]|uniref:Membrane-bound lytic murein transglycosylase F n=1 Tax=Tamilnaduibacter salinus TaxID=1484056 RepID=A0A2U1D1Q5_9GAMM|nr:membrane-bound lytic murein transglycosylase F [Tamilnaduibacter salinus]
MSEAVPLSPKQREAIPVPASLPTHLADTQPARGLVVSLIGLLVGTVVLLTGCSRPSTVTEIRQEGVLHVITRRSPSVYFEGPHGATGFEYELVQRLAKRLGVELRLRVVDDYDKIVSVLDNSYAHIGMGGFAPGPERKDRFQTVTTSLTLTSTVVYNRDVKPVRAPEALSGRVVHTVENSNHIEPLKELRQTQDNIRWIPHPKLTTVEILKRVNTGEVGVAVVDSTDLALNHVYFPDVKKGVALTEPRPVAWLLPRQQDGSLRKLADQMMRDLQSDGTLAHLRERFFGHLDRLDYVGARTFLYHVRNRLPRYQAIFRSTADHYDLDWRLLAAIGYQESHWRPNAVSPTGVRGLMMLTRSTARYVGIDNRRNAEQSIDGGAQYFRTMRRRIPEDIPEPDRTWFALAAYNVGMGHLEDARKLTQRGGDDPHRWADVKEYLPRLAEKQWYTKTEHGYARGYEPVVYVQNIRRYYDVLRWLRPNDDESTHRNQPVIPPLPSLDGSGDPQSADNRPGPPRLNRMLGEAPPTL